LETHDAKQEDDTLGARAGDPARPVWGVRCGQSAGMYPGPDSLRVDGCPGGFGGGGVSVDGSAVCTENLWFAGLVAFFSGFRTIRRFLPETVGMTKKS